MFLDLLDFVSCAVGVGLMWYDFGFRASAYFGFCVIF